MLFAPVSIAYLLSLGGSSAPGADARDFKLHNNIGEPIYAFYVIPHDTPGDEWGPDRLGVEVLADGTETDVSFSGFETCEFDIMVTVGGEKGSEDAKEWKDTDGVNLCGMTDLTCKGTGSGFDCKKKMAGDD